MTKVLLLWTIITLVSSCVDAGKWITAKSGQRFYVESAENFDWFEAIDKCTQMNMELISMDSQKKNLELNNLIKTNMGFLDKELWTGGHDHNVSRHFEWISTGEAFVYTNWESYQPSDTTEHCVFMVADDSLKWYDHDCHHVAGFVCEENHLQKVNNAELVQLKASSDNQAKLLREKTAELDSLKKELNAVKAELSINESNQAKLLREKTEELELLKASSDNQKQMMKEKTEELDSLKNELNALNAQLSINQTNQAKLLGDKTEELELLKVSSDNQKEMLKEKVVELDSLKNELNALNAQLSSENVIKEMLNNIQKVKGISHTQLNQPQNQNQMSDLIKSMGIEDISNPIYCATQAVLLKAKNEEADSIKDTNKILLKLLSDVLQHFI